MDNTLHRARTLYDKGTRESILQFMQEVDPNGSWTDKASLADGLEPLTFDEALIELEEMIAELEATATAVT